MPGNESEVEHASIRVVRPAGDCDGDYDIDLADFIRFGACYTGPQEGDLGPDCSCADLDADGDADLADLVVLQAAFTGPQQ